MVTDLEKQFFDTFGIEPDKSENAYFTGRYGDYPTITDRILLELMFLITDINISFELRNIRNIETFKTALLEFFIDKIRRSQNKKLFKHQVQELFKGE